MKDDEVCVDFRSWERPFHSLNTRLSLLPRKAFPYCKRTQVPGKWSHHPKSYPSFRPHGTPGVKSPTSNPHSPSLLGRKSEGQANLICLA